MGVAIFFSVLECPLFAYWLSSKTRQLGQANPHKLGGTQYRPLNVIILIIGTPQKGAPIPVNFGNPKITKACFMKSSQLPNCVPPQVDQASPSGRQGLRIQGLGIGFAGSGVFGLGSAASSMLLWDHVVLVDTGTLLCP